MARSPIPDLIERFHQMRPEEQRCFLDLVDPQPEPELPAKKASKKGGPRSARASGMAAAIKSSIEQGKAAAHNAADADAKCVAIVPGSEDVCGKSENNGIHDQSLGYGGYHEFEAGKAKAATQK